MCMSCMSMMWHCGDPLIVVYEMKKKTKKTERKEKTPCAKDGLQ